MLNPLNSFVDREDQSAHCWTDRSDICCIVSAYGLIYLAIDKCDTFDNAREAGKDVASSIPDESIFYCCPCILAYWSCTVEIRSIYGAVAFWIGRLDSHVLYEDR